MIITEFYKTREDGVNLYRTYSNANLLILQQPTNIEYEDAIDVENNNYTYIETDKRIPIEENDSNIQSAFNILMGRE